MVSRRPAVAGQFYPAQQKACVHQISQCLAEAPQMPELPDRIVAGIVPHAGWTFSGNLAAMVFSAIKQVNGEVDTFVIFGAIHNYLGAAAAVYDKGAWLTPLGEAAVDETLAAEILKSGTAAEADCEAHRFEHSIEVQVPFIQHLFSSAKILPILVPPAAFAAQLGAEVAGVISAADRKRIVCVGSTDLTHYGPRYGFCPHGAGTEGIDWAKQVNDSAFINLALEMRAERMVEAAIEKSNACGAGAAAATVAAAKGFGKTKGVLLAHTHSSEVMEQKFGEPSEESVGYAAIVF